MIDNRNIDSPSAFHQIFIELLLSAVHLFKSEQDGPGPCCQGPYMGVNKCRGEWSQRGRGTNCKLVNKQAREFQRAMDAIKKIK